ncbi:MAG: hypothetical protein AAGC46_19960 [Solirubrobacteraceae bacterium]|nr:hypothetical protein [Patulibacter sp.]
MSRALRLHRRTPSPVLLTNALAATAALALASGVAPAADAAAAKPKKTAKKKASTKPVLKVSGISVNGWYSAPGGKAKADDDTNACYRMLGPAGTPPQFQAFPFVHAVNIPADAPTTVVFHTPWDSRTTEDQITATGRFSDVLFKTTKSDLAASFGGPSSSKDFYRYSMLPTGLPVMSFADGAYTVTVTTTVKGKPLTASGSVTVAC